MTSAALAIALHFASTWTGRSLSTLPASEFRQKALRVCDGLRCSMKTLSDCSPLAKGLNSQIA